jgi:hypothetical protein
MKSDTNTKTQNKWAAKDDVNKLILTLKIQPKKEPIAIPETASLEKIVIKGAKFTTKNYESTELAFYDLSNSKDPNMKSEENLDLVRDIIVAALNYKEDEFKERYSDFRNGYYYLHENDITIESNENYGNQYFDQDKRQNYNTRCELNTVGERDAVLAYCKKNKIKCTII